MATDNNKRGGTEEVLVGNIRHRSKPVSKGIQALRSERKFEAVLEAWRAAKKRDPKAWGIDG